MSRILCPCGGERVVASTAPMTMENPTNNNTMPTDDGARADGLLDRIYDGIATIWRIPMRGFIWLLITWRLLGAELHGIAHFQGNWIYRGDNYMLPFMLAALGLIVCAIDLAAGWRTPKYRRFAVLWMLLLLVSIPIYSHLWWRAAHHHNFFLVG